MKAKENISGKFSFDLKVISFPNGNGSNAETSFETITLDIQPIADKPFISATNLPNEKLEISSNGWLDISNLGLSIGSDDFDNSEDYSI